MISNEEIKEIITESIKELNYTLESPLEYSDELHLVGSKSSLDSIGLVTLVTIIEEKISIKYDLSISLVSDKAFSRGNSPFHTCKTLTAYIAEISNERVI